MKQNKKGISLIVLVITIIVMIILASAVIITLSDTGIINKANEAVTNSNLRQVEQLATMFWAEAFLDENITTDEQYEEYVKRKLEENNIELDDYYIRADSNGVKVEGPDNTKPTLTIVSNKSSMKIGQTITYILTISDNREVANVSLETEDIILNGFTATKVITGEGNTRTITLSNIQGEVGKKSITIAEGVATDLSGNTSEAITTDEIELEMMITLGSLITSADDYGKYIDYTVTVGGKTYDKWQVYYEDEKNGYVFIRMEDVFEAVSLDVGVPVSDLTDDEIALYDKFIVGEWPKYELKETYNCQAVAKLIKNYGGFANKELYGEEYVMGSIGAPTVQLLVEGWNSKKLEPELTITLGTHGYLVPDITTCDNFYIFAEETYQWVASPHGDSNDFVVGCGGNQTTKIGYLGAGYIETVRNLRPVVCLSADIPAKLGNGVDFSLETK